MRLLLYLIFLVLAVGSAAIAVPVLSAYYEQGIGGVEALTLPGIPRNSVVYGGTRVFLPVGNASTSSLTSYSLTSLGDLLSLPVTPGVNATLVKERLLKMLSTVGGLRVQLRISVAGATLLLTVDSGSGPEEKTVTISPSRVGVYGYVVLAPERRVRFEIRPGRPWVTLNLTFTRNLPEDVRIVVNSAELSNLSGNLTAYAERLAREEFHAKLVGVSVWCDLSYRVTVGLGDSRPLVQAARRLLQVAVAMPTAFAVCAAVTYAAYRRVLRPRGGDSSTAPPRAGRA